MSRTTTVDELYEPLSRAAKTITKNAVESSQPQHPAQVLFRFWKPEQSPPWGGKFTVENQDTGYEKTCYHLASTDDAAFILHLKQFDQVMKDSDLFVSAGKLEKEIEQRLNASGAFQCQELQAGAAGLSTDDKKEWEKNEKKITSLQEDYASTMRNIFDVYRDFMKIRNTKFLTAVQEICEDVVKDLEVKEIRVYSEAYEVNVDSSTSPPTVNKTDIRLPDKDNEENEDPSVFWLKYRYEWHVVRKDASRGKTLETFNMCREKHMRAEFQQFGYAEEQFTYLYTCLKATPGLTPRVMLDQVDKISEILYLLPSLRQHPSHIHNTDITPRNRALSDYDRAQIILRAMPAKVKEQYRALHRNDPIPTNPEELADELDHLLASWWQEREQQQALRNAGLLPGGNRNSGTSGGGSGKKKQQQPRTPKKEAGERKQCDLCKQGNEKDHVVLSHWTRQCERYHPDGKRKLRNADKRVNQHASASDGPPAKKSKKDKKKKKKKKKSKSKKSKKKSRRHESSSDDSSHSSSGSSSSSSSSGTH